MNADISTKLAHSVVEHVPMLLDEERLYNFFLSTDVGIPVPYSLFSESIREERTSLDNCCLFYPAILIRNNLINHVPKYERLLQNFFWGIKSESPDYMSQIQAEKTLVNMMNTAALKSVDAGLSVLGMLEIVDFDYSSNGFSRNEKKTVKPQLIIPGYEKNNLVKSWENSKTKSESSMGLVNKLAYFFS